MEVVVKTPVLKDVVVAYTGSHGRGESIELRRGGIYRPVSAIIVAREKPPERFAIEGLKEKLEELATRLGHPFVNLESLELKVMGEKDSLFYYYKTSYTLDGDAVDIIKWEKTYKAYPQRLLDSVALLGDVGVLREAMGPLKELMEKGKYRKRVRSEANLFFSAIPTGTTVIRIGGSEVELNHWTVEEGKVTFTLSLGEGLKSLGPKVLLRAFQFWALYRKEGERWAVAEWVDRLSFTAPLSMAERLRLMGEMERANTYLEILDVYLDLVEKASKAGSKASHMVDRNTFEEWLKVTPKG